MDFRWETHSCLGIPVPASTRKRLTPPPEIIRTERDTLSVEILENLGERHGVQKNEREKACFLAEGASDMVIILQRPNNSHNYALGPNEFVEECATLRAVNELIRFVTKGSRSIHSVTVLDHLTYMPERGCKTKIKQEDCEDALAAILRLKRPKAILQCHIDSYSNSWLAEHIGMNVSRGSYIFNGKMFTYEDGSTTTVFQSFHPSIAITKCWPSGGEKPVAAFRALMICHFVTAFSALSGNYRTPKGVKELQNRCGSRLVTGGIGSTLSDVLKNLHSSNGSVGALVMAESIIACNKELEKDFLRRQIGKFLLLRGAQEERWLPFERNEATVTLTKCPQFPPIDSHAFRLLMRFSKRCREDLEFYYRYLSIDVLSLQDFELLRSCLDVAGLLIHHLILPWVVVTELDSALEIGRKLLQIQRLLEKTSERVALQPQLQKCRLELYQLIEPFCGSIIPKLQKRLQACLESL